MTKSSLSPRICDKAPASLLLFLLTDLIDLKIHHDVEGEHCLGQGRTDDVRKLVCLKLAVWRNFNVKNSLCLHDRIVPLKD